MSLSLSGIIRGMVCLLVLGFGFVFGVTPVWGLEYTKADTATLHLTNDWVEGVVPGSGDTAVFDDTLSAGNAAVLDLATNWTVGAFSFASNMNGEVTIGSTGNHTITMTPGNDGTAIDLSSANNDVTINVAVSRGNHSYLNVGRTGRTLTLGGDYTGGNNLRITGSGGTLVVTGSTVNAGGWALNVGYNGDAIVDVCGTGAVLSANDVYIGQGATGIVNLTEGTFYGEDTSQIGISSNGYGEVNISGGAYRFNSWANRMTSLGVNGGSGVVTVSGSGVLQLGRSGYGGNFVEFGSTGGTGVLNLNGGTFFIYTTSSDGLRLGSGSGAINFNGGLMNATTTQTTPAGLVTTVKSGGARIEVASGKTVTLNSSLVQSPVSPGGGLIKSGAGSLVLNGTNTYTGATTVSNGVLRLTHPACLDRRTALSIWSAASVDLDFVGENEVRELIIDGTSQRSGTYSAATPGMTGFLTGAGALRVGPSGAVFIVR